MALIISSSFTTRDPQVDSRIWVDEVQTFDDGTTQLFSYLADPMLDFQAVANQRANAINTNAQEIADASQSP